MSDEVIGLVMIVAMVLAIFVGFPISFTLIFLGLVFGYWGFGELVFYLLTLKFNETMSEQTLAAVRALAEAWSANAEACDVLRLAGESSNPELRKAAGAARL